MSYRTVLIAVILALPFVARAAGDRVLLTSGRTIEGQVVAEDEATVTVQVEIGSSTLTQRYNRSQVRSIERVAPVQATYVTLPVVGAIGTDVTAAALRAGFNEARRLRPRYVVLAIDSPGGNVGEMLEIVRVVAEESRDTHVVAFVKNAHSAAAVIAMTCRTIFLTPGGSIGATVPFQMNESGIADVDAKFRSIFRAQTRAAVAFGGHADLLIRGMQEADLEIYLSEEDGHRVLRTCGPGKLLKSKGEILTLTAAEAAECGLADTATTLAELGRHLAGDDPWHEGNRRAWQTVIGHRARERWQQQLDLERHQRQLHRRAVIERIRPEWEAIDRRMTELLATSAAAENAVADLSRKFQSELDRINLEYRQALHLAGYQTDPNAAVARALEVRNSREGSARQFFEANVARIRGEGEAALLEAQQLQFRRRELLATIPGE